MPIGSGAQYVNVTINVEGWHTENALTIMSPTSPLRELRDTNGWWPISCTASSSDVQMVPIPDNYIVGPPGSSGDGTLPNRPGGVLRQDGTTIQEFQYAQRCNAGGPLVAGAVRCTHSIYGSGMCGFGAQGGSGLSGVGGALRVWEVNSTQPIRHALKITLDAHLLSNCNGGYRWPAVAADGYHNSAYTGPTCDLRMGSLLALPQSYPCPTGTSLLARMCAAMRDYGLYVGDTHNSPGWTPLSIIGEYGTNSALAAIGGTLQTYTEATDVIANNSPSSIGGGGTPLVPTAPPIGN